MNSSRIERVYLCSLLGNTYTYPTALSQYCRQNQVTGPKIANALRKLPKQKQLRAAVRFLLWANRLFVTERGMTQRNLNVQPIYDIFPDGELREVVNLLRKTKNGIDQLTPDEMTRCYVLLNPPLPTYVDENSLTPITKI